jgi:hypothetical protein
MPLSAAAREPSFEERLAGLLDTVPKSDNHFDRFEQAERVARFFESVPDATARLADLAVEHALQQEPGQNKLHTLQVLSIACDRAGERSYMPRLQLEAAKTASSIGWVTQAQSYYLAALRSAADTGNRLVALEAMAALQPDYPDVIPSYPVSQTITSTE